MSGTEFTPVPILPSAAYRFCDRAAGWVVLAAIVFAPWAFGATVSWAIWTVSGLGYAAGFLTIVRTYLARREGFIPERWDEGLGIPWIGRVLGLATVLILLYVAISAINVRAVVEFSPEGAKLNYRNAISWLPQSMHGPATQKAAWRYLGVAGAFWALRIWLLTREPFEFRGELPGDFPMNRRFPVRAGRLLWTLTLSTTLLAIASIVQRAEHGDKLLFLLPIRPGSEPEMAFGPFSYRGNAAQYFNFIWPWCLGFWWTLREEAQQRRGPDFRAGSEKHVLILPCVGVIMLCPIFAASRGGVLILAGQICVALLIMAISGGKAARWIVATVAAVCTTVGGGGLFLGDQRLLRRFSTVFTDHLSGRGRIYEVVDRMLPDFRWLGSGAETFSSIYGFYRPKLTDTWEGYAHNDWLETWVTFGGVGSALLGVAFLCVAWQNFRGRGLSVWWPFAAFGWLAVVGLLSHARFDFPLQVFAVFFTFMMGCALLSCIRTSSRFPI